MSISFQKHKRILYVGLKYDYGIQSRGFSYEYVNFLETLRHMENVQVEFFPFDEVMRAEGRDGMNHRLITAVAEQKYDLCFFVLFTDDIKRETIQEISDKSGAVTLNWFGDDHWRFSTFSKSYAPHLHWVVTTDSQAVEKYHSIGCRNVIKSQWGVNHFVYLRFDLPKEFEVTFVGQAHSKRKSIVNTLGNSGVNVKCWGKGWNLGRLTQEEMIKTYSRSKINLNFTESSVVFGWKPMAKVLLTRRADDSMRLNSPKELVANLQVLFDERRPQIKGRNFEIPGSGGFLLTSHADNLEEYFVPGNEVAVFEGTDDLIEKARYYLSHESEREQIRRAGYERTLSEHTYERRFRDIFEKIGI